MAMTVCPLPGAQVQSLVEELRFHMPRRVVKKKKKVDTNKIQIKCKTSNWSGVDSNPPAHCPVTLRTDLIPLNLGLANST